MFVQWLAYNQSGDAIETIHASGGHVVMDIPMFRACLGVDASNHGEYFRYGNPGAGGQTCNDLSPWNWDGLRPEAFRYVLDPIEHWQDFGCDGVRVDAIANAFRRAGQIGGGDESVWIAVGRRDRSEMRWGRCELCLVAPEVLREDRRTRWVKTT